MNEIKELKGCELGLYDSDTGKSVLADKVVDVTDLCTNSAQCVIKYATVKRGRIAQICDWYEPGKDLGMTVHYFIDHATSKELAEDMVFKSRSRMMGFNAYNLAQAILDNAPSP